VSRLVRSYELIYIVHPEVDETGLAAVNETVTGLVERSGGKVARVDPWGLRRLAYPIQRVWEGQYVLMHLELDPQGVSELERGLGLAEQVLRHLVVRLEEVESGADGAELAAAVEEVQVTEPEAEPAEPTEAEEVEPSEQPSEPAAE
jgi:small subunit ribosomal protein S6